MRETTISRRGKIILPLFVFGNNMFHSLRAIRMFLGYECSDFGRRGLCSETIAASGP